MEKTRENSQKKLLISKIGYRNPEKLIKSSFFRWNYSRFTIIT